MGDKMIVMDDMLLEYHSYWLNIKKFGDKKANKILKETRKALTQYLKAKETLLNMLKELKEEMERVTPQPPEDKEIDELLGSAK